MNYEVLIEQWHDLVHVVVERIPLMILYDNHDEDGEVPSDDDCAWVDIDFDDDEGDPPALPCETGPGCLLFIPSPKGVLRLTLCDQHAAMMLLKRARNTTHFGE